MARILMVSKPVAPPWNDSSKNLVRDLASSLRRHQATIMTRRGEPGTLPSVDAEAVYGSAAGGFAPGLRDNLRVMLRLVAGPAHDVWHFFFAPNPRSSMASALAARARRARTVHTVCSAPRPEVDLRALLFADRTIVLSRHTEQRALRCGVERARLHRIAPAVAPLELPAQAQRRQARVELGLPLEAALVLYPGDLEFSDGAERTLRAYASLSRRHEVALVLACRAKTVAARKREQWLRELARELGVAASVTFVGETPRIHDLLATADVVALPAETLYAKMDLPLVLIEAMWLARPVVCAQETPAAELVESGAGVACAPSVEAVAAALGALLEDAEQRARLGQRARQAALERYHPAVVATAHEALYDELLR
ncbi:MAG: glycosyltransferase family 4 protein [Polyangiales bacterium]